MELKRVGVGSAAKVAGAVYAGIGVIIGGIIALVATLGGSMMPSDVAGKMGPIFGLVFGFGAIIVLPIFYGVLGVIVGAVGAALYNLVSGLVGGVELDLE